MTTPKPVFQSGGGQCMDCGMMLNNKKHYLCVICLRTRIVREGLALVLFVKVPNNRILFVPWPTGSARWN